MCGIAGYWGKQPPSEPNVRRALDLMKLRGPDDQRAFRAQPHIHAGCLFQLGGKSGPARLTDTTERDKGLFAGLGLGAGREHPRRRMACASTGSVYERRDEMCHVW